MSAKDDDPRDFTDAQLIKSKLDALAAKVDRMNGILEALVAERDADVPPGFQKPLLVKERP